VSRIQAAGDLNADLQKLGDFAGLAGDAVLEGLALQQFHGDERPAFEFADVVYGANIRMIQRGGGARFAPESFDGLRVLRNVVREKFQRDVAAQARVLGFVDHAHSAAAEFIQDSVVGDIAAKHRGSVRHGRWILAQRFATGKPAARNAERRLHGSSFSSGRKEHAMGNSNVKIKIRTLHKPKGAVSAKA
jgi:hypothetical protein